VEICSFQFIFNYSNPFQFYLVLYIRMFNLRQLLTLIFLTFLTLSAFFIRLNNYENSSLRSIDEFVYFQLSMQLADHPFTYNSIPYAKYLMARGRKLPKYFTQPLFKHPPLFSYLGGLSIKIFGKKLISVFYVSLLLGVLMIPLIYWLGTIAYDWRVGLLASLFLWMDPVSIMTGQKVWMDTSIGFYTLAAISLFIYGVKSGNDRFFFWSGIFSGLATLTRYNGFLVSIIIAVYALIYARPLFKNKSFLISLCIPLLMLTPWFYWNWKVYGFEFLTFKLHTRADQFFLKLFKLIKSWNF